MVIFQAPGGSPGYNQFESLDEAVAFVETLRNDQNVTNARMFALEEIKFDLKPYFKVELQALNPGSAPEPADSGVAEAPFEQPQAEEPAPSEPVAEEQPPEPAAPPPPQAEPAQPEPEPAPPTGEPAPTFGAFTEQAPAAPAPAPAPQPEPEPAQEQPARRGLFGR